MENYLLVVVAIAGAVVSFLAGMIYGENRVKSEMDAMRSRIQTEGMWMDTLKKFGGVK